MYTMGKTTSLIAVLALVVSVSSGCAATGNTNPTPSQTASASDLPTWAPMSSAKAKAAYRDIAKASCLAAQNSGEVDENDTVLKVMVAKAQAYQDYTAAYLEKPKTYGVIWEIDAFAGCTDWFTFSMSEEAGREAAIDVTFDSTDGSFTAKQDLGELGVSTWKYGVTGGLISSALDLNDSAASKYQVTYGVPDAAGLEVLKIAVDNYLASIK